MSNTYALNKSVSLAQAPLNLFMIKGLYLAISFSIDIIDVMLLMENGEQNVISMIKEIYLKKPIQLIYLYAVHNFCVYCLLSRTNLLFSKVV